MLLSKRDESRAPSLHRSLSTRSTFLSLPAPSFRPRCGNASENLSSLCLPAFSVSPESPSRTCEIRGTTWGRGDGLLLDLRGFGQWRRGWRGSEKDRATRMRERRACLAEVALLAGMSGRNTVKTLSAIRRAAGVAATSAGNNAAVTARAPLSSHRQPVHPGIVVGSLHVGIPKRQFPAGCGYKESRTTCCHRIAIKFSN